MKRTVDEDTLNRYSNVLYVFRLPKQANKKIIFELFSQVGPIRNVFHDPACDEAFVEYESECSVLAAMLELANIELFRTRIKLSTLSGSNSLPRIFSEYLSHMNKLKVKPSDIGCRTNLDQYDILSHERGFCDPSEIWEACPDNRNQKRQYNPPNPFVGNHLMPIRINYAPAPISVPMMISNYGPPAARAFPVYQNYSGSFGYNVGPPNMVPLIQRIGVTPFVMVNPNYQNPNLQNVGVSPYAMANQNSIIHPHLQNVAVSQYAMASQNLNSNYASISHPHLQNVAVSQYATGNNISRPNLQNVDVSQHTAVNQNTNYVNISHPNLQYQHFNYQNVRPDFRHPNLQNQYFNYQNVRPEFVQIRPQFQTGQNPNQYSYIRPGGNNCYNIR